MAGAAPASETGIHSDAPRESRSCLKDNVNGGELRAGLWPGRGACRSQ